MKVLVVMGKLPVGLTVPALLVVLVEVMVELVEMDVLMVVEGAEHVDFLMDLQLLQLHSDQ